MSERIDLRAERMKAKRRKRAMIKSWIILGQFVVIVVLVIALVAVSVSNANLRGKLNGNDRPGTQGNVSDNQSADAASRQEWMKAEVNKWYLQLVNPDVSVSEEFIQNVGLTAIDARFTDGKASSKYFDSRAVAALNEMCEAALNDGIRLTCISTYRTYDYQQGLFNNRIQKYINQGYSQTDAQAAAARVVAKPGTSEHHMGLAVDFNSVEQSFENTNAYKWLQKNAENYGFIMRYAEDKQSLTKIIYEPWHYRYVGVEHAKAINDLGYCLEEYIEYLKNGGK